MFKKIGILLAVIVTGIALALYFTTNNVENIVYEDAITILTEKYSSDYKEYDVRYSSKKMVDIKRIDKKNNLYEINGRVFFNDGTYGSFRFIGHYSKKDKHITEYEFYVEVE